MISIRSEPSTDEHLLSAPSDHKKGTKAIRFFWSLCFVFFWTICSNVLAVVVCRLFRFRFLVLFPFIENWRSSMSWIVSVLSFLKLLVKVICNRAELFSTSTTNKNYGEINKFFDRISVSDGTLRLEINGRIDGERFSIGHIKLERFRESSIDSVETHQMTNFVVSRGILFIRVKRVIRCRNRWEKSNETLRSTIIVFLWCCRWRKNDVSWRFSRNKRWETQMIDERLIERCCCAGNRLHLINRSEESDTVDLLGG